MRLQLEPPCPRRQAAREARVVRARQPADRVHVGGDLHDVGQELVHVAGIGRLAPAGVAAGRGQRAFLVDLFDARGKSVLGARVDHPCRVDRGRQRAGDRAVGQVEQVVDVEPPTGKAAPELLHQVVNIAGDLRAQTFRPGAVRLHQVVLADRDRPVLLLDGDQPPQAIDHDEVDLAIERGACAGVRPVNAVEDRVLVREFVLEGVEGLEFARRVASAGGSVDFVRDDSCHGQSWMAGPTSSPIGARWGEGRSGSPKW